ncbi:MAG: hypothetical protein HY909_00550 [Deltaproteobacteria bacterium]|nr:hypothetical protein [Deltaproteobacteria bacterium]
MLVAALLGAPAAALGQCDAGDAGPPPDLLGILRDTFPADQSLDVPTDGVVRLRYFGRAPEPPTVCVRPMTASTCIAGTASVVGDEVVWIAPPRGGSDALVPFTTYVVSFSDASGGSNRITFTTGRGPSAGPPVFGGVSGVSAAPAAGDPCDGQAVDITVRFPRATAPAGTSALNNSAWPDSDIEYVIFETRGPGLTGARERDRVRLQRTGSSDVNAQRTFRLSGRDSTGPVCFSIQAFDPWGRRDDNTQEKCVNPAQGNFFAGCGVHPAGPLRTPRALGLLGLCGVVRARRRRRGVADAGAG